MVRPFRLLAYAALLLSLAAGASGAPAVIIVVRHAEKAALPADDPPLTPAGNARATELARLVEAWSAAGIPVRGLFASEVKRTQQTLAPIAAKTHLTITVTGAKELDALVQQVQAVNGGMVVVAGHSNTVPQIVKALGGSADLTIGDAEYDRVFVITPKGVIDMRYGARTEPAH